MNRPYYALTGPELIDVIVAEFRKKAEASGYFPLNKTFPQVSWDFTCEVELYPAEPPKYVVHVAGSEKREGRVAEAIKGTISGGRKDVGKVIAPDQVRVEAGMKISKPVTKPGMGTIDELVDSIQPHRK